MGLTPEQKRNSDDTLARFLRGDTSMLKCTICKSPEGDCDCWTKCREPECTWSFRKGASCRNPAHDPETSQVQP